MGTFRFLLAVAVAVNHYEGFWGFYPLIFADKAVQCFYMVSGFLISLILSGKYDTTTADGLRLFYTNRALRIFVPYWTFLAAITVSFLLTGAPLYLFLYWHEMDFATRLYLVFTNIFVLGQEWTNWLSYHQGTMTLTWDTGPQSPHLSYFHIISQAWTVSLELMFYAIAPFLVRRHWLVLAGYVVATIIARRLFGAFEIPQSGFVYRFFPFELGLFLVGVLSQRLFAFLDARDALRFPLSVSVTAAMLAMLFAIEHVPFFGEHRYRFYVLVALALPFLFDVSRRLSVDRWFGELSYPIYLCHIAVLYIGRVVAGSDLRGVGWFTLTLVLVSIAVSICYVYLIDVRFEKWRQRRSCATAPRQLQASPM